MNNSISIGVELNYAFYLIIIVLLLRNLSDEAFVPWLKLTKGSLFIQPINNHFCNVSRVIIGNKSTPTWSNSFASVDQPHRNDWHVILWLDELSIILNVRESMIIGLRVYVSGHSVKICEDVSCTSVIFASLISGAELPIRH